MNRNTSVVIVGGGPVGLSMAILLQRFGIDFVMLERNTGITEHPKARGTWVRTMEIFRQWGIEDRLKLRALPDGADFFSFVESMTGHEWGRTIPEPNGGFSPTWKTIQSQDAVEEELLAHARTSEIGRIRHRNEFIRYEESAEGLEVTSRDLSTGETITWKAAYLVAADGAGSTVRRQAGIEMRGPAALATMANEFWQADLSHIRGAADTAVWRVFAKDAPYPTTSVLNTNGRDRWLSILPVGVENDDRPGPRTDDEVVKLARTVTGIPNLDVKVINRSVWRLSRQVAANFRKGRVLLAGDAAHRFPPNGGYGMNSGIQDAHNLAWKLALVLNGQAADRLLDSYDLERRPVAESNADFSFRNAQRFRHVDEALRSGNRERIEFWIRDSNHHIHSVGQSLGFSYDEGAVIPDGTIKPPLMPGRYEPSDRPGSRFPHIWLDPARRQSTLDWFDKAFVLVTGPDGGAWMDAEKALTRKRSLPLQLRVLAEPYTHMGLQVGAKGALLVRPDGHVAWRMPWTPADPGAELDRVFATLLD
jgi:2-polyprenyl-6-methoxyphenol hydroxylase-like FAD-dependent oxidoreductase